mmetsp:Transcript_54788/g.146451  ORF Transcript_54788/g.146451 Transcript_54788/m.146451 type:complete len:212 (-) Transcript_54788:1974-2609(-)
MMGSMRFTRETEYGRARATAQAQPASNPLTTTSACKGDSPNEAASNGTNATPASLASRSTTNDLQRAVHGKYRNLALYPPFGLATALHDHAANGNKIKQPTTNAIITSAAWPVDQHSTLGWLRSVAGPLGCWSHKNADTTPCAMYRKKALTTRAPLLKRTTAASGPRCRCVASDKRQIATTRASGQHTAMRKLTEGSDDPLKQDTCRKRPD